MLQRNAIVFFLDYAWAGKNCQLNWDDVKGRKKNNLIFILWLNVQGIKNLQSSIKVWEAAKTIKYDGENAIRYLSNFLIIKPFLH